MAGKKDKQKSFNNPFSNLKGLSVSAPEKKPAAKEAAPPPPPPENDVDLFAEEMERLGVARREGAAVEPKAEEPPAPAAPAPPASDRELFLSALDGFDTVFEDALPEGAEGETASPRRMRLLRRGRLLPEAKLDLHCLTRDEAREKVRYFLDDACYQGKRTVLIVTGRGKSSGGEPVLRAEVERFLAREAGAWVVEWGRAPRQYGGEGALVVFLKGAKKGI